MPELPDVELSRRYLAATALHRPVDHVEVPAPGVLEGTTPQGLGRVLKGARLVAARRHGKYLFALLDRGGCLVLHFGMTGALAWRRCSSPSPPYVRCRIVFRGGYHLMYTAPRKLGRIATAAAPAALVRARGLGPDALRVDEASFVGLAARRRGGVKAWLMDQGTLAGIGNVYSDEILFQARLHPRRRVDTLGRRELCQLHGEMRRVLQAAITARVQPARMPRDFLLRRRGARDPACPRCGARLAALGAAGRTAWYCPRCQRPPRATSRGRARTAV